MTGTNKNLFIIISTTAACILMYVIEQNIGCSYIIKTVVKIILFTGLPFLFAYLTKTGTVREALGLDHIILKDLKAGFIIGAAVFVIIIAAYLILGFMIDFESIKQELQIKLKITAGTFIFTALYITFINSLIEELFFRGFIFPGIYSTGLKKTAFFFSSFLFGLYHMAIFKTWFPPPLTVLSVASLILTGIVFNWINLKNRNFLNSWLIHIFADSAIILIGIKMFYF